MDSPLRVCYHCHHGRGSRLVSCESHLEELLCWEVLLCLNCCFCPATAKFLQKCPAADEPFGCKVQSSDLKLVGFFLTAAACLTSIYFAPF